VDFLLGRSDCTRGAKFLAALVSPAASRAEAGHPAAQAPLDTPHLATLALQAGKSVRWVADQLGHAHPALTLRVYAHAMPGEQSDLSFADFGGSERLYTAPGNEGEEAEARNTATSLVGRQGLEPRTLGLKARRYERIRVPSRLVVRSGGDQVVDFGRDWPQNRLHTRRVLPAVDPCAPTGSS